MGKMPAGYQNQETGEQQTQHIISSLSFAWHFDTPLALYKVPDYVRSDCSSPNTPKIVSDLCCFRGIIGHKVNLNLPETSLT